MGEVKLVKRFCACGCGKSWKAMKTSKSFYFSEIHYPPEEIIKKRRKYVGLVGVNDF